MEPRDGILSAAQVVFARHGYRHTAMAMVADEAGLSRQAVYHHFSSKEAVFAAMVDELHEAALASASGAALRAGSNFAGVILGIMLAYHESLVSNVAGSAYAEELVEESSRQCGAAISAHARKFEKILRGAIDRLVQAGKLNLRTEISSRDVVEMIVVAGKGVKLTYAGGGPSKFVPALKRMVQVICAGVAAPVDTVVSLREVKRMGIARRIAR